MSKVHYLMMVAVMLLSLFTSVKSLSSLELPELLPGDIIFSKNKILGGEHVALYVGGRYALVVHAVPPVVEVVELKNLENHWVFKLLGGIGEIYRVKGATEKERCRVAFYALAQVLKPYTLLELKCLTPWMYSCCTLVWRSWLQGTYLRIDLSVWWSPIVTPWDLKNSLHTYKIYP